MPAIASRVFLGVAPAVEVAAWRKRERQSSSATVANALMREPSVFRFASVVVQVLLPGSKITLPQPPVSRSTRLGVFPAAIRSPSRFPQMMSPFDESHGGECRSNRGELVDGDGFRERSSQQRHQGDSLIRAFGNDIKNGVFWRRSSIQLKSTFCIGFASSHLRWSAFAGRIKRHGCAGNAIADENDAAFNCAQRIGGCLS